MNQTLRNRLIAHAMALKAIPVGTPNPVGISVAFFTSCKFGDAYREASAWLDGALELMRSTPDNPYTDDDAFMADLLEKIEARKQEQRQTNRDG